MNLDFYRTPVGLSDPAARRRCSTACRATSAGWPSVVQGLLMHEHIALDLSASP